VTRKAVTLRYRPREHGRTLHQLIDANRSLVCVWHRRAGKTVAGVNALIKSALTCPHKNPQVLYVAPFRNQAKKVAWRYFLEFTEQIPGVRINSTELTITLPNGGLIMLGGADNPDTYRGMYFDHVCMDEFAQFPPRLWTQVIRPALSDRLGKMLCIGTPAGRNGFYRLYKQAEELPDWASMFLPVSATSVIDPLELAALRREMAPNEYEQEYQLSWTAAITGAIYGSEMSDAEKDGRIATVRYDAGLLVNTAFDLGIRDSVVWLFQVCGTELRMLEARCYSGEPLIGICQDLKSLPYTYGKHIVPHDAKLREYSTGVTRIQTMQNLGFEPTVCRSISVEDGIEATRNMLRRTWFDAEKCAEGIEALIQYKTEYDDIKRTYSLKPLHDWTSHAADALRMVAVEESTGQASLEWGRLPWDKVERNARGAYGR
jgi:hypothetical protein